MNWFKHTIFYYILMFFILYIPCFILCMVVISGWSFLAFLSTEDNTGAGASAFVAPIISIFVASILDIYFLCRIGAKHIEEEYGDSKNKYLESSKLKEEHDKKIKTANSVFWISAVFIILEIIIMMFLKSIYITDFFGIPTTLLSAIFAVVIPIITFLIIKKNS